MDSLSLDDVSCVPVGGESSQLSIGLEPSIRQKPRQANRCKILSSHACVGESTGRPTVEISPSDGVSAERRRGMAWRRSLSNPL